VLDDDLSLRVGLVLDEVVLDDLLEALEVEDAADDLSAGDARRGAAGGVHGDVEVNGVTDEALVLGREVADLRVAGVRARVEDGERPAEHLHAGVVDQVAAVEGVFPEHRGVVDAHLLGLDGAVDDGQHGAAAAGQIHRLLDLEVEQLAHLRGGGHGPDGLAQGEARAPRRAAVDCAGRGGHPGGGRRFLPDPLEHPPAASQFLCLLRADHHLILLRLQALLVPPGPQRGVQLGLHDRPRQVERRIEVHGEGDGPPAHQRQTHLRPVGVLGVLDDGPAQPWRSGFLGERSRR